ncbi:tail fiber domain-containing protein [Ochrobactrum phage vB_OspM_OC]|nr:tail fiber domain-containing protein [Ochrobactrum phage vB_OspM_OC]
MADMIRINELPVSNNPQRDDLIPIDGVDGTKAAQLVDVVKAGTDLATDIEAVAGTNTTKTMTPFTTKAAIDAKVDGHFAPSTTTITVGFGMLGGGSIANNVFINFSQQTIDSLAKADTAAQAADVSAAIAPLASKNYVDSVASSKVDKPADGSSSNLIQGDGNTKPIADFVLKSEGDLVKKTGDTMSGELSSTTSNNWRIQHPSSNTSMFHRYDGTNYYLMCSDTIDGTFNTLRPITVNYTTGKTTIGNSLQVNNGVTVASGGVNVTNGDVRGKIIHDDGGGYLNIGSYGSEYGSGYSRMWWNQTAKELSIWDGSNGNNATIKAYRFSASNAVYAGSAYMATDGNIAGSAWTGGSLYSHLGSTAMRAYPRRSDGGAMNFYWSGQSGQPTWLWGGTDGTNMYVYNPSNFSVNYAASAGNANSVGGWTQPTISNQIESRAAAYADDRIARAVLKGQGDQRIGYGAGAGTGQVGMYIDINSNGYPLIFTDRGTGRGSIQINSNSTVYNTSSDHRLKENVRQIVNYSIDISNLPEALERIFKYRWVEFDWIGTDVKKYRGIIAHEVQDVIPFAVDGEKDAVNEDGTPKHQMVDYSKMVPDVGAAVQELTLLVLKQAEEINELKKKIELLGN